MADRVLRSRKKVSNQPVGREESSAVFVTLRQDAMLSSVGVRETSGETVRTILVFVICVIIMTIYNLCNYRVIIVIIVAILVLVICVIIMAIYNLCHY